MRIRPLSDLHLEFQGWVPPSAPADVVVLAGDIDVGVAGVIWGRRCFPDSAVVYVPGNHEFYDSELEHTLAALHRTARTHDVHLLDRGRVEIAGVRFLGTTLWTDFALYGAEPGAIARAMAFAERAMIDYRAIRYRDDGLLVPGDTLELHRLQLAWLAQQLAQPFAGSTVVVTHHLPGLKSVHPRYAGDMLNTAFASDLSDLLRAPVALWIHGHTHESMDYVVNGTRVVCNPRGYLPHEPNSSFDPNLVIEIAP
jgi:3',5'-cyclic AMP phosphodiesterase CpdA